MKLPSKRFISIQAVALRPDLASTLQTFTAYGFQLNLQHVFVSSIHFCIFLFESCCEDVNKRLILSLSVEPNIFFPLNNKFPHKKTFSLKLTILYEHEKRHVCPSVMIKCLNIKCHSFIIKRVDTNKSSLLLIEVQNTPTQLNSIKM